MLDTIEFAAVVASAIYGVLRAARKQLDVVGMVTLAFAVAFGGGTLRDLFLDRHPLFWIANAHYPVIVFVLGVVGSVLPRHVARVERLLAIPDALGLGLFAVVGAGFALEAETSLFVASVLGVVTGTFGGVIGDVICNEIPSLFRSSPLYATCAFVGAWTYLLLGLTAWPQAVAVTGGIVVTVLMRLAALRWDIRIPSRESEVRDQKSEVRNEGADL
jgi:uncharacterized membrane protein YeiH